MSSMASLIDPHAHTLHSDGTDTPEGLVLAAKRAGLDVVGITDHDTTQGWAEAVEAARRHGVGLLRGVEVSAVYQGNSVHILGYLMDPQDHSLNLLFEDARRERSTRLAQMASNLAADYPLLDWDALKKRAGDAALGRPHLADELVLQGYFPNRSAAFEWALHPSGPYYVPQKVASPTEVVELIRQAGGVPVLAHPQSSTRGWRVPEDLVAEMAESGLFGIERDHRDHDAAGRETVERLAASHALFMTGGSDYHGTGKPNILGENGLDPYILAEIEAQGTSKVVRS